jgi:hypothetical protein
VAVFLNDIFFAFFFLGGVPSGWEMRGSRPNENFHVSHLAQKPRLGYLLLYIIRIASVAKKTHMSSSTAVDIGTCVMILAAILDPFRPSRPHITASIKTPSFLTSRISSFGLKQCFAATSTSWCNDEPSATPPALYMRYRRYGGWPGLILFLNTRRLLVELAWKEC